MWIPFLTKKGFHMSSPLRTRLNKMELLRGRIGHLLRWRGQCLTNTRRQNTFGRKRLRQLVTLLIDSIFTSFLVKWRMNYSPVTNHKLDTLEYLAQNVTFLISIIVQSLLLNLMKVFYLVTDRTLTPTMSTRTSLEKLKRR